MASSSSFSLFLVFLSVFASLLSFGSVVFGDVYMHTPRGSNNRFQTEDPNDNEVKNDNRLFDSQDNNDGGYDHAVDGSDYTPMEYYVGSRLTVEWSSQHACGPDSTTHCEIILQYMCDQDPTDSRTAPRDGRSNTQIPFTPGSADTTEKSELGMHENYYSYHACTSRSRNRGLFLADQTIQNGNNDARFTRQEVNGNRRGIECPEERDYYPYWAPSQWIDIAILTNNLSFCEFYHNNSQNTNEKFMCVDANLPPLTDGYSGYKFLNGSNVPAYQVQAPINQPACTQATTGKTADRRYTWYNFPPHVGVRGQDPVRRNVPFWGAHDPNQREDCAMWKRQASSGLITAEKAAFLCTNSLGNPLCLPTVNSRDNHLGFVVGGYLANFTWLIPDHVSNSCVLRLRYNISTDDYPGWSTFSDRNDPGGTMELQRKSPIYYDPFVRYSWSYPLSLALDTSQYGRTFQDRSHTFAIVARTSQLASDAVIWNLNVRGKRGHVAQVYPSVAYDFVPKYLHIRAGDFVHFQWEGSQTVKQTYVGGGKNRTERHNIVQIRDFKSNFPLPVPYDGVAPMFEQGVAATFAMAGQDDPAVMSQCVPFQTLATQVGLNITDVNGIYQAYQSLQFADGNCMQLNLARSKFNHEPIRFNTPGQFYYMSTRDNIPNVNHVKGGIWVEP